MSQCQAILQHLMSGHSLTPLDALAMFNCLRLGARVYELKQQGEPIASTMIELPNHKRVAKYSFDFDEELKRIAYG